MDKKHNYTNHGKSSKRLWITFLFFCIITTGFMQAANKVFAQSHCHSLIQECHVE